MEREREAATRELEIELARQAEESLREMATKTRRLASLRGVVGSEEEELFLEPYIFHLDAIRRAGFFVLWNRDAESKTEIETQEEVSTRHQFQAKSSIDEDKADAEDESEAWFRHFDVRRVEPQRVSSIPRAPSPVFKTTITIIGDPSLRVLSRDGNVYSFPQSDGSLEVSGCDVSARNIRILTRNPDNRTVSVVRRNSGTGVEETVQWEAELEAKTVVAPSSEFPVTVITTMMMCTFIGLSFLGN